MHINYTMKYVFKWLLITSILGAVGSLLAYGVLTSIDWLTSLRTGISPIITISIASLLLLVIYKWDSFASGAGTRNYLLSVNDETHKFTIRHTISKLLSSIITIGMGGSGGLTGPSLLIGSSFATTFERWFRKDEVRLLFISGAAALLGSILHSPFGAGIFVVEITYRTSLHYKDSFPAIMASLFGYLFGRLFFAQRALFQISYTDFNIETVPFIFISAILGGFAAWIYITFFKQIAETVRKSEYYTYYFIASFLVIGAFVHMVPEAGGLGFETIQALFLGRFSIVLLATLFTAKLITTTLTVGSGGSGGLVLPALYLGGIAGAITISILGLPSYMIVPLVLAGMASCLSGTANAPIAVSILIIEIGGIEMAPAAVLGSIIGYAITNTKSIYDTQYRIDLARQDRIQPVE